MTFARYDCIFCDNDGFTPDFAAIRWDQLSRNSDVGDIGKALCRQCWKAADDINYDLLVESL